MVSAAALVQALKLRCVARRALLIAALWSSLPADFASAHGGSSGGASAGGGHGGAASQGGGDEHGRSRHRGLFGGWDDNAANYKPWWDPWVGEVERRRDVADPLPRSPQVAAPIVNRVPGEDNFSSSHPVAEQVRRVPELLRQ